MLVYEATKSEFVVLVHDGVIVDRITERFFKKGACHSSILVKLIDMFR